MLVSSEMKVKAQVEYCIENDLPMFAPKDGRCYSCGRDVFEDYSYKEASSSLITGCRKCNYSFCG